MNLLPYCQKIDTECSDSPNSILKLRAIKLDGKKSLKESLGLADVKSCDYLRVRRRKATVIECSNLPRQHQNELKQYNKLTACATDKSDRALRKAIEKLHPEKTIREELRYKCIHSLLLLHRLADRIGFKLDEKFQNGIEYVVAICAESSADVMAFQNLEGKLFANLKGIVQKVKVVPASERERILATTRP